MENENEQTVRPKRMKAPKNMGEKQQTKQTKTVENQPLGAQENKNVAPVQAQGSKTKVEQSRPVENKVTPTNGNIKVLAPMPGNIWKIKTSIGAKVEKHEVLLILEAMKMENEIVAPESGTVTNILVKEGDAVEPGKVMVEMA